MEPKLAYFEKPRNIVQKTYDSMEFCAKTRENSTEFLQIEVTAKKAYHGKQYFVQKPFSVDGFSWFSANS